MCNECNGDARGGGNQFIFKEKTRSTEELSGNNGKRLMKVRTQGLLQELCDLSHWIGGMSLNEMRNITEAQNEGKI